MRLFLITGKWVSGLPFGGSVIVIHLANMKRPTSRIQIAIDDYKSSWKRICAKELNCRQNMSEHNLKSITLGFSWGDIWTFIALILLTQVEDLIARKFKTIAGLVLPTFAVYTTTIIIGDY